MPGCDLGVGGAKYKTPALVPDSALSVLNRHRASCHGVRGVEQLLRVQEGLNKSDPPLQEVAAKENLKFSRRHLLTL